MRQEEEDYPENGKGRIILFLLESRQEGDDFVLPQGLFMSVLFCTASRAFCTAPRAAANLLYEEITSCIYEEYMLYIGIKYEQKRGNDES